MTWALLSESTVTILKENANPSLCTSMKSTFSCKTSDGTAYEVAWYAADWCTEFTEASFSCEKNSCSGLGCGCTADTAITSPMSLSGVPQT